MDLQAQLTGPISTITRRDVIYASIVALLAWLFSVYDFILFGNLLPVMSEEFGWSTVESVRIATWVSVGTFLVALTVGPITDYFGRRNGLMITVFGAALSSLLTAFTSSALYLIVVRALSGFGYSEQAVNTTYLSEIYGARRRGFLYSFIQGGWPIGVLFAAGTTALILPYVGWRGVFAIAFFPAIVIGILRMGLKETPRFERLQYIRRLIRSGRHEEAEELGKQWGIQSSEAGKFVYFQLFTSDLRQHTIFLSLAFLMNWIGVQVLNVLATTVLTQAKGVEFTASLWFLVVSNALAYVGYVLHGYVGDLIGRRETIAIGWILSGLAFAAMLLAANGYVPVLIGYSLGLFFQIGPYSALFTYMGESFPTRARASGASFVNAMGPIGAIIGSALFATFLNRVDIVQAALYAGAIPQILSGLLLLGARRVPPGTELEEIAT